MRPTPNAISYTNSITGNSPGAVIGRSAADTLNTVTPVVYPAEDVRGYKLQYSLAFDNSASWSTIITTGLSGFSSPSIVVPGLYDGQSRNLTRIAFSPSEYSIDDTKSFWIRIIPVNRAGIDQTPSAPLLVLPFSGTMNRAFNIAGTIGTAEVEISLPGTCNSMDAAVNGSDSLFVSYEPSGMAYRITGMGVTNGSDILNTLPSFSTLYLKGSGASTSFWANFRLINNMIT